MSLQRLFAVAALLSALTLSACGDDDGDLSIAEQFEFENQKIDAYISSNGLITVTDENSALRYRVISQGDGLAVGYTLNLNVPVVDSVTISYTARLLDTEETVLSVANQKIAYTDLITGIRLGLQFVREGGSINFFVPSAYAFGTEGAIGIPGNATLIYDLDLIEVHAEQLREDIAIIDAYLEDNNIGAQEHPTGLRYRIGESGNGNRPTWLSVVVVNYEGRLLESGNVFDSRNNVGFSLQELITGWLIGLPQIRPGGSITLYIPSTMAYGVTGVPPDIPANATLIFNIDLIAVQ